MFEVSLKNGKKFECDADTTIFNAAKSAGIFLEHSCLTARCRSCVVKVMDGKTVNELDELVLSEEEKGDNFVLSCNAKPVSDLSLDIEDMGDVILYDKKIVPAKINSITSLAEDVIKLSLRFPPRTDFKFLSGQYVNLIKGTVNRSYSVAVQSKEVNNSLDFFIKKYENGLMSKYWFEEAKQNDLLRLEGPLGTFFYRESEAKDVVFLATGTGVAPVKSILEELETSNTDHSGKRFWVVVGARFEHDLFWEPEINGNKIDVTYIPVLSRPNEDWKGETGYVQDILVKQNINFEQSQVYACGSNQMIESAKKLLIENSLKENDFYSDAFICTN